MHTTAFIFCNRTVHGLDLSPLKWAKVKGKYAKQVFTYDQDCYLMPMIMSAPSVNICKIFAIKFQDIFNKMCGTFTFKMGQGQM